MSNRKYNIEETRAGEEVIRIKDLLIDTEYEESKLVVQLIKYEQHLRDLLKNEN